MALEKETDEVLKSEFDRLKKEIAELQPHEFTMSNGKEVKVKFNVHITMLDGKAVNAVVGNRATVRCPVCDATCHSFSQQLDFISNEDALKFGIGLLHAEIKSFEHLLHLSYRLPLQKWDVVAAIKETFAERKEVVQNRIYDAFSVKADLIVQGHGTTYTGNIARKCFQQPEKFAEALEIDVDLVKNISLVLYLFKSKKEIDLDKVEKLRRETNKKHNEIYDWARMNPSLHKLLMHGTQAARKLPMPLAYFAEDASEAWHKFHGKNITNRARQFNRKDRLKDIYNRATCLSDPLISLICIEKRIKLHKVRKAPKEALRYFLNQSEENSDESEISDDESSDELESENER